MRCCSNRATLPPTTRRAFIRYHKRLLAFAKTDPLAPGESVTLTIDAPRAALASWDPVARAGVVEPGNYTIIVGQSSVDEAGSAVVGM